MCNIAIDQLVLDPTLQTVVFSKLGVPLAGGKVTFYRQSDQSTLKNVYYLTNAQPPYSYAPVSNPMTLSATGSTTDPNGNDVLLYYYPFLDQEYPYHLCDPNTSDPYYIEVLDANGNLQFTRQYFPLTGKGTTPPSGIPTYDNYVINNRFWRNIGQTYTASNGFAAGTLTNNWTWQYNNSGTVYYQTLAPSQHDGFSMPDFNYVKNINGSCTETIYFKTFPGATEPVLVNDIQPEFYINHVCTTDTSASTLKVYQFPVSLHLATLSGQPFSFSIQGMCASGNATIGVYMYQYCGAGVLSPAPQLLGTITFTGSWTKWSLENLTFPQTSGVIIGSGGTGGNDDAYYLQIAMPTGTDAGSPNAITNLSFCLPSIYLNNALENIPTNSFETYDQIDAVIAAPRTGDVKISMNNAYPLGWVPLSGGTLANVGTITAPNVSTVPIGIGITYQGTDAWGLYSMLWNAFSAYNSGATNILAQMYSSTGAAVAYGSNAWTDWNALKQIALTSTMGKVLLGTVPVPAMPLLYNATVTGAQLTTATTVTSSNAGLLFTSTQSMAFGEVVQFTTSGGGSLPSVISAATNYYAVPISATTFYVGGSLGSAQAGGVEYGGTTGTATINVVSQSLVLTCSSAATVMNMFRGVPITFSNTGGALPGGLSANTIYYAVPTASANTPSVVSFCVATSFSNAMTGTNLITYTTPGTGTTTVTVSIASSFEGEYGHSILGSENGQHTHGAAVIGQDYITKGGAGYATLTAGSGATTTTTTGPEGFGVPANNTQPAAFFNMYMKL